MVGAWEGHEYHFRCCCCRLLVVLDRILVVLDRIKLFLRANVFLAPFQLEGVCVHNQTKYRPSKSPALFEGPRFIWHQLKVVHIPNTNTNTIQSLYTNTNTNPQTNTNPKTNTKTGHLRFPLYLKAQGLFDTRRRSCSSHTTGGPPASSIDIQWSFKQEVHLHTMKLPPASSTYNEAS